MKKFNSYSQKEIIGQVPSIFQSRFTPKEVLKDMHHTIFSRNIWRGEFKNKAKDGSKIWQSERRRYEV